MIRRRKIAGSSIVKVSFVLAGDDSRLPASLVGEFNDWDPAADPFRRRSNGTVSAVVSLQQGESFRFRYRSHDGSWFDEENADGYEANSYGTNDCVVTV